MSSSSQMEVSSRVSPLLLLVVLFVVCLLPFQQRGLVAATGMEIECIPVKLCPMAMRLIKVKPYAPETVRFLRYTHCGFLNKEPMVWCNKFLFCLTPDSKNGTCTEIKKCDPYIRLLQRVDVTDPIVKKYLKEFSCSTEFDPEIKVCCPHEEKLLKNDIGGTQLHDSSEFHDRFSTTSNGLPNPRQHECGKEQTDNKIFGGTETALEEYPWMALLKYDNNGRTQYGCGGVLINENHVLTAAHCVDSTITRQKGVGNMLICYLNFMNSRYSVVLGEYDVRNETDCIYLKYGEDCADSPQELLVQEVILHPKFKSSRMLNDIALIRLQGKARYNDYVQPICLPPPSKRLIGNETFSISGWGRTPTSRRSPVKRKARVNFSSKDVCNRYNGRPLSKGQICAGEGKGVDSCYGDSGGPLMLEERFGNDLVTFQIGIVSYGFGRVCGALPGVYTYVPPYVEWINSNMNNNSQQRT